MRSAALSTAFAVALVAACGGAKPVAPSAGPRAHKLPTPLAMETTAPGAVYLTLLASHVQPNWAQFLEDCRLRLAPTHPLNDVTLVVVAEIAIDRAGAITLGAVRSSRNVDFDQAVRDVMADVHSVEPPPTDLLGDDDRLHLEWTFARDGRQAGPATARMVPLRQDVVEVTTRLLEHGELPRAARRVALAKDEAGVDAAARLVAIAALREALAGTIDVRVVAVDAIARAQVVQLVDPTRALLQGALDSNLQLAVTRALATLHDISGVDRIAQLLGSDVFVNEARALADTRALVELGADARAAEIVRTQLLGTAPPKQPVPNVDAVSVALHAHALAPSTSLDSTFERWFAKGTPRLRADVCAAQPIDASSRMGDLISRGLRDADASVRASCAEAAGRQLGPGATAAVEKRLEKQLRELARDRDRNVRARAISSLSGTAHTEDVELFAQAATDSAPEVRLAAIDHYNSSVLVSLFVDPEPDVRAAAFRAWAAQTAQGDAERQATATRFAADPTAVVRLAALPVLSDTALIAKLAAGDTNDVASAALIRLGELRGRAASTSDLLLALAQAPPASADRVRIALAWLLAP